MSLYLFIAGDRPFECFSRGIQYVNRNMLLIEDERTILNIFKETSNGYAGVYTLQNVEQEFPGDFTISIHDDGTFESYETPISSYIGMGHYSIEDSVLTLKEDGAGCTGDTNYYRIADGSLSFIEENSANYHFVPLEDGASFVWTEDAE